MVESHATDEIKGMYHWAKGKGWRKNPKSGFPAKVILAMEASGLKIVANNRWLTLFRWANGEESRADHGRSR